MRSTSRAAAALIAIALAAPCWAGQVKLEIHDGLVTLSAKDASLRDVLNEWSRVGQTRIVNAERAPGGLLNIELSGVPEAKALDIVLRSVAGYVAAPRRVSVPAASRFDRIIVMAQPRPASGGASPAAVASSPTPAPAPYDPRSRMGGYQPPSLMVDDQDEPVQPQPQPQPQPTMGTPNAAQPGMMTSPAQGTAAPGQSAPGQMAPGQMTAPGQVPAPGQQPQPNSPATVRPGVMTPGATPRPPGSPGGGPGGN